MKLYVWSFLLMIPSTLFAAPYTGLFQTIDDKTNLPKSVVVIYEYEQNVVAGRVVALYGTDGKISETISAPVRIADKIDGKPFIVGTDVIWSMKWDTSDNEYSGGKIMDPANGKIYSSVMWQDNKESLNVRGKIGPFGRTQVWRVIDKSTLPPELQKIDTKNWKPNIRK